MTYKVIDQIDLKSKRVFIRVDFNVPLREKTIADESRVLESLPTIRYAVEQKAKVILASHLGRPKGRRDEKYSLMPVASRLSEFLKTEVIFPEDSVGDAVRKLASDLRDGDVMLLENLRFHPEEEANDPRFAASLAQLAEVYINDAFGASHRAHASTVGMVGRVSDRGIGFLVQKELKALGELMASPKKPFLAVFGGAKVSDKIGVIENLFQHVDAVAIGGGMAYTFLKARGIPVGRSLVEEGKIRQAEKILSRAEIKGVDVVLPKDSVVVDELREGAAWRVVRHGADFGNGMGVDIGPESVGEFKERIAGAQTIFWNGPLGVIEIPPFDCGSVAIAQALAESPAHTVAGGGDSLRLIKREKLSGGFDHVSTGGGASMTWLEGKSLPGLTALGVKS